VTDIRVFGTVAVAGYAGVHRAVLSIYRAHLNVYKTLLSVYKALLIMWPF